MFGLVKSLHPPTGVEHSCYCNFVSPTEKSLVVAGTSQFSVYKIIQDVEESKDGSVGKPKHRLEKFLSTSLFGNIVCMKPVKLHWQACDVLLLAFRDAKMSVVEYDPDNHELRTLSLHFFEEEEYKAGFYRKFVNPIVRVDPEMRCAAMLFYGGYVAIFPFKRDTIDEGGKNVGKTPVSSSYIVSCTKIDSKLINVRDIEFLHGYFEPTLVFIFEPLQTWSGRVPVRNDTCSFLAISINVHERVHPAIWSVNNLPFDCFQAVAMRSPIGGVLVLAATSLVYLSQSSPPRAVSLNSITDSMTSFPMDPQPGVSLLLDGAVHGFLSPYQIVMSVKSGDIYMLTLLLDSMKAVNGFSFDKVASSVLATCMSVCDDGFIFLGSRLGNSLLVKYSEKDTNSTDTSSALAPPEKKRKTEDWADLDLMGGDMEDLEVYGKEKQVGDEIKSYTFEVCDSLLNIGPCRQMTLGEPPFLSEELSSVQDPDLELVLCSGYGKNGALSVLQRSIRPQIVTSFDLPGCVRMWTVFGKSTKSSSNDAPADKESESEVSSAAPSASLENGHAYLILSKKDSTMILETGSEIREVGQSGFSTDKPTFFACNLGDKKLIVQVTSEGVNLLEGVNLIHHLPMKGTVNPVCCSSSDPYVLVGYEDRQHVLVQLVDLGEPGSPSWSLTQIEMNLSATSAITTSCLYKDVSGLFTSETGAAAGAAAGDTVNPAAAEAPVGSPLLQTATSLVMEDEDDLLYGDADSSAIKLSLSDPKSSDLSSSRDTNKHIQKKETYWAVFTRVSGDLEIYSVPSFEIVFRILNFPLAEKTLTDSAGHTPSGPMEGLKGTGKSTVHPPQVKGILLAGLGHNKHHPHLLVMLDDDLVVYEAIPRGASATGSVNARVGRLSMLLRKVEHGLITRGRKSAARKKKEAGSSHDTLTVRSNLLQHFTDIGGYSGVFVGGFYPHWLLMTAKGVLRCHPMSIDGPVTKFAPFHNVNCPRGFLYFNKRKELRVSVLPVHLSYDSDWSIRKIPLRATPYNITYHMETKTYIVVSSQLETSCKQAKIINDERDFEECDRGDRFVYPLIDKFSFQLYSPSTWEPIPGTKVEMEQCEHIICCRIVYLRSEGTVSGLQGYLAIGTNYCYNEEITSRGRLLLYDIIEVVPEPGQPLTKNKFKSLYDKEQKGPVTALNNCEGFLISAIGQKLYIWQLKDNDLIGVSFIDTLIYVHTIVTIKNIILIADVQKSISLLRFQSQNRVISMASRDPKPLEVYGIEFIVDNSQLGFLVSDRDRNLFLYMYQPEAPESLGGTVLLRKGEFNLGSHVNTFTRVRCKLSDPSMDKRITGVMEKRHVTYFATLDGGLGFIVPLSERIFRRLHMLQGVLLTSLPHTAGLNPKLFRAPVASSKQLVSTEHNMVDGDLCWKFLALSLTDQTAIAKRMGTSTNQLIEDLLEIDRVSAHF